MILPVERLRLLARPRNPDWLPNDAEIVQRLASHQSLYRFHKPRYQLQLLKDLAALLPAGDCRILDVGAGSGLIAEMIASIFPWGVVVAVDVATRVLPTVGVPFRTFDGQNLPDFEDDSFDCALLCNVLHHVETDQRRGLLQEVLRVTGGGRLVIKDLSGRILDWIHPRKLAWLDFAGNAPLAGWVRARYLGARDWEELFGELRCTAEMLPGAAYRSGWYGWMFSNRFGNLSSASRPRRTAHRTTIES